MSLSSDTWTFQRLLRRAETWDLSLTVTYLLLTIALTLAAIRRFYQLDTYSLWSDELWGVVACSQGSWWAMIQDLIQNDSHPPGYQTLLYFWMQLFGNSDFSIRAPSALVALIGIVWTFIAGRRHFSASTGVIAAFMLAGAYQAIYFSQEARAYIFLICLAPMFSYYFCELFLVKDNETRAAAQRGFWFTTTALLYMHYVGAVIVASAAAAWLLFWWRDGHTQPAWRIGLRSFSIPLLLYAPWLPVMYHHLVDAPAAWGTPPATVARIVDTYRFVLGPDNTRFYLCTACLLILILIRPLPVVQQRLSTQFSPTALQYRQRCWWFMLWLCVAPVLIFALQSRLDTSAYTLRHFTYTIPYFALLIACLPALIAQCIHSTRWRARYVIAIGGIAAILNTHYNIQADLYDHYRKEDYRGAVDIMVHDKRFIDETRERLVITNSTFFDHYLSVFGIKSKQDYVIQRADQLPDLYATLAQRKPERFYYLEVLSSNQEPILEALTKRYTARCYSKLNKVKVVKFTLQAPSMPVALTDLNDCPLRRSVRPQIGDD